MKESGTMKPILGHQIGQQLCDALGLPKMTRSFTLRCAVDEAVTVECEYYPEDGGIALAMARYHLVALDEPRPAAPLDFDAWMRDRTEQAHREYIGRTSSILGTDFMGLTVDGARAWSRLKPIGGGA